MLPYFPYPWQDGEMQQMVKNEYLSRDYESQEPVRFGGILLPFIGGLLVGGLFLPRPCNSLNCNYGYGYQQPYYQYPPNVSQYPYMSNYYGVTPQYTNVSTYTP